MTSFLTKFAATAGITLSFLSIGTSAFAGSFHKEIWITGNGTEEKWGEIEFDWNDSVGTHLDSWSDLNSFLYTDASGNEYDLTYAYNAYSNGFSFNTTTQQLSTYAYRYWQPTATGYDGFYNYKYEASSYYYGYIYKNLTESMTYLYEYDGDGKTNNAYQTVGYLYDYNNGVSQSGYTSELRDATSVPESSAVLGLLAISFLGAGSAIKSKLKP